MFRDDENETEREKRDRGEERVGVVLYLFD